MQKLFDGDEEKCLKEVFEIENQDIKLIDFYNNPLRGDYYTDNLKNTPGEL